jgi:hypothetical protein
MENAWRERFTFGWMEFFRAFHSWDGSGNAMSTACFTAQERPLRLTRDRRLLWQRIGCRRCCRRHRFATTH